MIFAIIMYGYLLYALVTGEIRINGHRFPRPLRPRAFWIAWLAAFLLITAIWSLNG